MRVAVWPADQFASGHYRLIFPAEAAAVQGADIRVDTVGPRIHWDRPWDDEPHHDSRVLGCDPYPADVVVLQRPGRRWWSDLIPHLQASGTRVVVDVDDRFDRIHTGNIAHGDYNPADQTAAVHSQHWIAEACKRADLVTASTPALASRYGHGHGVVLPNLVPARYLTGLAPAPAPTLGWSGNVQTHPGDLNTVGAAVRTVLDRRPDWTFHVVGTGEGVGEALGVHVSTTEGWVPFEDYPEHMARIAVGVVPLADNPFNEAKSCLKMIEFASQGVPVVVSPTPDNCRMHKAGVGVVASSPNQWRRHLLRLVHSPELRADMAGRGRQIMAAHTYEARCGRWVDAWTSTTAGGRRAA